MKRKQGIHKKLMQLHLFLITLTVVLFECAFFFSIYQYYYTNTEQLLSSHAQNSADFAMRFTDLSPYHLKNTIPNMVNEFQMKGAEMQIISPSGAVLASSAGFVSYESIQLKTIQDATNEQPHIWKGKNDETDERVMAVSVPLSFEDQTIVYFRYIISLSNIDQLVQRQTAIAIGIGIGIIFIVWLLSRALARKITKPLIKITEASKRFAKGDFDSSLNENYIGELGTLAKSFNEMCQAMLQHENLKDQFISSISHELRTPLTSLKGWSDTLIDGSLEKPDEMKAGMTIIKKETERLIDLVEELLDFSRMNNEVFRIQPDKFNVRSLIEEVTQQLEKQFSKKHIDLTIHVPNKIEVVADRNRMKQVLLNLVDNAIKFNHPKGTIAISGNVKGSYLNLVIEDSGEGIKLTDLPHISTPFYKPNNKARGAGLGLAISKRIIELHHGRIEINSHYGEGTKILISMPLD